MLEKGIISPRYHNLRIKILQKKNYIITFEYEYYCSTKKYNFTLLISNNIFTLKIIDNYFRLFIDIYELAMIKYNNLKNNDIYLLMKNNYICLDDIFDKIYCEVINELDPMLYKMFMTIFNKPKIKSTNSIHFADN